MQENIPNQEQLRRIRLVLVDSLIKAFGLERKKTDMKGGANKRRGKINETHFFHVVTEGLDLILSASRRSEKT